MIADAKCTKTCSCQNTKIATINIQTLKSQAKQFKIVINMQKQQIDVLS